MLTSAASMKGIQFLALKQHKNIFLMGRLFWIRPCFAMRFVLYTFPPESSFMF